MSRFSTQEVEYLKEQRLGRLATLGANGDLHVVPVGYGYNADEDCIDIGGRNITETKKYRDALRYERVAFVVDDVVPDSGPRFVEIRGRVQALPEGGKAISPNFQDQILRLTPTYIVSFGINDEGVLPGEGEVRYSGRNVE